MTKHTKQGKGKYMIFRKKKENPRLTNLELQKRINLQKDKPAEISLSEKIKKERQDVLTLIQIYNDAGQKSDAINLQSELQRLDRIVKYFEEAIKKILERIENKNAKYGSYSLGKIGTKLAKEIIKSEMGERLMKE